MRASWVVGVEDLEDIKPAAVDQSDMERPEDTVEARLVDTGEIDGEMDSLLADGNQLETDTDNLRRTHDVLASSLEEGNVQGVDETTSLLARVAVESYCERWNIPVPTKVAVESFGDATRVQATQVACEGLKETLTNAYAVFLKYVQELIAKLKEMWKRYKNAGTAIKARGEKLAARLKQDLGQQKESKIKGAFLGQLMVNAKLDPQGVISMLPKLVTEGEAAAGAMDSFLDSLKTDSPKESVYGTIAFGVKAAGNFSLAVKATGKVNAFALPGSAYMAIYEADEEYRIEFIRKEATSHPSDVATPSTSMMRAACEAIIAAGEALEGKLDKLEGMADKLNSMKVKCSEELRQMNDAYTKGGHDAAKSVQAKLRASRAAVANISQFSKISTDALRTGAAGLIGFVTAGIAAYGKGEAKAAKTDEK